MKHSVLHVCLRGAVVGSALMLGCSQGHCPCTPGPMTVTAARVPADPPRIAAPVARLDPPRPARRPPVQVLEVLPADGGVVEQEVDPVEERPSTHAVPPVVVPAARDEEKPALPCYGHASDYRWLTGELRYSPARGAWCLRYADRYEDDDHGGSVTLVGASLSGLRAGQEVCVEGEWIDPDSHEPSPPYRVHRLRLLP